MAASHLKALFIAHNGVCQNRKANTGADTIESGSSRGVRCSSWCGDTHVTRGGRPTRWSWGRFRRHAHGMDSLEAADRRERTGGGGERLVGEAVVVTVGAVAAVTVVTVVVV